MTFGMTLPDAQAMPTAAAGTRMTPTVTPSLAARISVPFTAARPHV